MRIQTENQKENIWPDGCSIVVQWDPSMHVCLISNPRMNGVIGIWRGSTWLQESNFEELQQVKNESETTFLLLVESLPFWKCCTTLNSVCVWRTKMINKIDEWRENREKLLEGKKRKGKGKVHHGWTSHWQVWRETFVDFPLQNQEYFLVLPVPLLFVRRKKLLAWRTLCCAGVHELAVRDGGETLGD